MMRRREVETPTYIDFARRVIRSAGKRVADADDIELAQLADLRDDIERAIDAAIAGQRARGMSWAYIGRALGITRQSAQERYAERVSA